MNSTHHSILATRLAISAAVLFLFAGLSLAQTAVSDRCHVYVANVTGTKSSEARFSNPKELGAFDTVVGEEELTTKTYRLPNTSLL